MPTIASLALTTTLTFSLSLSGCSGRTEHGVADGSPAQQPAAGPSNAQPPKAEPAKHLLMVVQLEPAQHVARTLMASAVKLPLPRRRGEPQQLPWRADVIGSDGKLLFSAPLEDSSRLRAEFPGDDGKLTGTTLDQPVASVTLRLPLFDNASEVRLVRVLAEGDEELGRVQYPRVAR